MTTHAPAAPSGLDLRHRLSTPGHARPTASAAVTPDAADEVVPDEPAPCHGYWSGPDARHTQHTPCPNPAEWAGLSDHDHAKTTLRCASHRSQLDLAIVENLMFCLTCKGHIRVMNWRPA